MIEVFMPRPIPRARKPWATSDPLNFGDIKIPKCHSRNQAEGKS